MGKNLKLAICLDDEGGMLFFGKRQSRDRVLISDLVGSTDGAVYIGSFSSHLFREHTERVSVVDNPFTDSPDGATVFIENLDIAPYEDNISEIILYKWNELYPSDKKIDIDLGKYRIIAKESFTGSSHDKITRLLLRR